MLSSKKQFLCSICYILQIFILIWVKEDMLNSLLFLAYGDLNLCIPGLVHFSYYPDTNSAQCAFSL